MNACVNVCFDDGVCDDLHDGMCDGVDDCVDGGYGSVKVE